MCNSGDKVIDERFLSILRGNMPKNSSLLNSEVDSVKFQSHGQKNLLLNQRMLTQKAMNNLRLTNPNNKPAFYSEPMVILCLKSVKEVTDQYKNIGKAGALSVPNNKGITLLNIFDSIFHKYGNNVFQHYSNHLWGKSNLEGWAKGNQESLMTWAKEKNVKTLIIGGEILIAVALAFSLVSLEESKTIRSDSKLLNKNKIFFNNGIFDIPKISIPIKISEKTKLNLHYDSKLKDGKRVYYVGFRLKFNLGSPKKKFPPHF